MSQLSNDRFGNKFEAEQKGLPTKKHQSSSDEEAREAEEVKKQKENERMEKEKVERERAKRQNIIDDRFKRLLEQEQIQKQKKQQERNQKDKERNMKIVEGWAKASKDQGKSLSRNLVDVQFTWEKTAQKVWIKVCFLGSLKGHILILN